MHQLIARVLTDLVSESSGSLEFSSARAAWSSLASDMEALDASAFFTLALEHLTSQSAPNLETDSDPFRMMNGGSNLTAMLVDGLISTVARMGAVERARVCGSVAESLQSRFRRDQRRGLRDALVSALRRIAGQMNRVEAKRICGQVGRQFLSWIEQERDASRCIQFAWSLGEIAEAIEPGEASSLCEKAIDLLMRNRIQQSGGSESSYDTVAHLLARLEPASASRHARNVAVLFVGEWNPSPMRPMGGMFGMPRLDPRGEGNPETLNLILTDNSRQQIGLRTTQIAQTAGAGVEGVLATAARVWAAPLSCRLTTQELVDLLKMPTCIGEARRIVLDHLGNRYSRRFVNPWAFSRFATEQKLDINLESPPNRPAAPIVPYRSSTRGWNAPAATSPGAVPF